MKIIGLTGGTGSGKSVVSRYMEAHGAVIVDADLVSRQIVEKGKPAYLEICAFFGAEILDTDGNILRRKLGEIVFHDKEKLAFLNQCTHRYIREEMLGQIEAVKKEGTAPYVILDAPLLFEAKLEEICDVVWVVYADANVRAKRVMERDGVTYDLAMARISNQKSWEEYKAKADAVIDNSKDIVYLQEQIRLLLG